MSFQEKHGINETDEDYRDHLISVTHEFAVSLITFKLLLYANISDQNTYKCEVKIRTGEHCSDSKPLLFYGKNRDGMDLPSITRSYYGEKIIIRTFNPLWPCDAIWRRQHVV